MDNAERRKQELFEALESFRADSGDLGDPRFTALAVALETDRELRVYFARLRQADVAIKAALDDVPVPSDLPARVSSRLAKALSVHPVEVPAATASRPVSRRTLIVGLTAMATSAALFGFIWLHNQRPSPLSSGQAIEEAMGFFNRDKGSAGEGVSSAPADFPISPDIRRLPGIRWRWVDNFLVVKAIAYDLSPGGGRATLYVANLTANLAIAGLPPSPSSSPDLSTGGNSAAAWQSGGKLYVLVVQGGVQVYASYLDRGTLM